MYIKDHSIIFLIQNRLVILLLFYSKFQSHFQLQKFVTPSTETWLKLRTRLVIILLPSLRRFVHILKPYIFNFIHYCEYNSGSWWLEKKFDCKDCIYWADGTPLTF